MKKHIRVLASLVLMTGLTFQAVSAEEKDGFRIQYKVGDGLSIGDGSNLVHFQGQLQGRFTYNGLEQAADNNTFSIRRGKIKIDGFTLDKVLKFCFQMNLATRAGATSGVALLEDYYADWIPEKYFGIKVGQFKVPFLMQELTSSIKHQFVDLSLSTGFFTLAYDLGVDVHGDLFDEHFNYAVFAMNGDGANTINTNQSLLAGLRGEWAILGKYEASESDVNHSEEPNLGVGVAYAYNLRGTAMQAGTIPAGTKTSNVTLDAGYKYKGFSAQTAAMITRTHEGAMLTNWGYNGQMGYFVIPKHLELAVRAAGTVFTNANPNQYEYVAGINYFIKGHGLKLQTDYGFIMNNRGANLNDHQVRTQLQVIF